MRQVKRRSALPVYIAAGAFALYALAAPLYAPVHFLIAAAVTAAVWLAADRLIKPKIEYVPEPEKPAEPEKPLTPAQQIMAQADLAKGEMARLAGSIADGAVKEKIDRLIRLSDAIARDAENDESDIPQIRKFQSYFLPSTIRLLNAYDRMDSLQVDGENITASKQRILQMLDTEAEAFQKQLDALYQNDAMDLDADIQVMEKLLAREGLVDDGPDALLRQAAREGMKHTENTPQK